MSPDSGEPKLGKTAVLLERLVEELDRTPLSSDREEDLRRHPESRQPQLGILGGPRRVDGLFGIARRALGIGAPQADEPAEAVGACGLVMSAADIRELGIIVLNIGLESK